MCPENINKAFKVKKRRASGSLEYDKLIQGIVNRDFSSITKAITLIENQNFTYRDSILNLLSQLPQQNKSLRLAVSGPPGAGKSTFIESLGLALLERGHTLAVLAIDPSSEVNRGSILGDKTRMEELSKSENAFIRPSANALDFGGIRKSTFDAIKICEAALFDIIIIETVGVGQSELMASQMTDLFCLLLAPAAGDELQGIKKGIVEIADIIFVNKSDGDLKVYAEKTKKDYASALHMSRPQNKILPEVKIELISSTEHKGISEAADFFKGLINDPAFNGRKIKKRNTQEKLWFVSQSSELVKHIINQDENYQSKLQHFTQLLENSEMGLYDALQALSSILKKSIKF